VFAHGHDRSRRAPKAARAGWWCWVTFCKQSRVISPERRSSFSTNATRADGSYAKKLRALGQVDVLIVDDWAMAPMAEAERRAFLEICDERYLTRSTLLTS